MRPAMAIGIAVLMTATQVLAGPSRTQSGIGLQPVYDCKIERKLSHGVMWASRTYQLEGQSVSGDFFHWNTLTSFPSKLDRPIDWEISYIWSHDRPDTFDGRRAELKARIELDVDVPEAGQLVIKRPFPIEPHGVIGSTALTTLIFRYSGGNTKAAHGEIPLGDLLAYAGDFEELDWSITEFPDRYGHAKPLASGKLAILPLREALAAIPAMKTDLAAKAQNFKTNCPREMRPGPPIMY